MILFSTTLKVKETFTKEKFVQLVIQWNKTSPYKENMVPDLNWNGEYNIRFGNDLIWLEIEEYRNKNIVAVRYEKNEESVIWTTDYIMNYERMEITITLERAFLENILIDDLKYSTPHFISMLVDSGYLLDDNGLEVSHTPIEITESNLPLLVDLVKDNPKYNLPVVYVSAAKDGSYRIDGKLLAKKLRGAAHILVQGDIDNRVIKKACESKNEYFGSIGIYFPDRTHKVLANPRIERVSQIIFNYLNFRKAPEYSSWYEVNQGILTDRYNSKKSEAEEAKQEKTKAENETTQFVEAFDADNQKLKRIIEELLKENRAKALEINILNEKLKNTNQNPLIIAGEEDEFYPNEVKEMILDAVNDKIEVLEEGSRRWVVLSDVLKKNNYQNISKRRANEIKNILKGYTKLSDSDKQKLSKFGFEIIGETTHYRLVYYGDMRFNTTLAKTSSDYRAGQNAALEIINGML